MRVIDLEFDPIRSSKKYEEFFIKERNKQLEKYHFLFLLLWGMFFIVLWMLFDTSLWLFIGCFSISIAFFVFLYFFIKFGGAIRRTAKYLAIANIESERKLQFKFDEEKIVYTSLNTYREVKWILIKEYEDHGDDFYIFYERHFLQDIISRELLGEDHYEEFKRIARRQVDGV